MNAAIHELEALCRDLRQFPCLSRAEHAALLARAQAGDRAAREQFLAANIPLVISIARRYVGHGVPADDLVQEGSIGLMRAVDRFDLSRGLQFSTYATWWVRQAISRACQEAGMIHLPVHVHDKLARAQKAQNAAEMAGEDGPDERRRAELAGLSLVMYQMASRASLVYSLDAPLADNEDGTLSETLIAREDTAENGEEDVMTAWRRERVREALALLSARERLVIVLRYGLEGGAAHTLEEISLCLSISRERARQLEAQALSKLRSPEAVRRLSGEPAPLCAPSAYAQAVREQAKELVS